MAAPTLAQLRTKFYNRFDEGSQNYIGTSEANDLINEGAEDLYAWIINTAEDYIWREVTGSITPTVTDFVLPADFFKALKVFIIVNGYYAPIPRLMPDEWCGPVGKPGYMIIDSYLRFSQSITSPTQNISLWYVPTYTSLLADTDTWSFQYIPGMAEYAVNYACISARAKEESDTSTLERKNANIMQKLEASFVNRDMGRHQHVVDAEMRYYPCLL